MKNYPHVAGGTAQINIPVFMRSSTDASGLAGLDHGGVAIAWQRNGTTTDVAMVSKSAGSYVAGGWCAAARSEGGASLAGHYEFGVPAVCFQVDGAIVTIVIRAAGAITREIKFEVGTQPVVVAANGITSNSFAANAITSNAISNGALLAVKFASQFITANSFAAGAITNTAFASAAIPSTAFAPGAITAESIAASAITSAKFASDAINAPAITNGALTPAKFGSQFITSASFGATALTAIAAGVWNALTSGMSTAGSIGKRLADFVTGDIFARLGAPAGGSVAADVAAIAAKTNNLPASPAAVGSAMTLTAGTQSALVAAIELELANDATGGALMQAIADKLAAQFDIEDLTIAAIAAACRDAVLDRVLAGNHDVAGTLGAMAQKLNIAGTVAAAGEYTSQLGTIAGYIDTEVAAIKGVVEHAEHGNAALLAAVVAAEGSIDALIGAGGGSAPNITVDITEVRA